MYVHISLAGPVVEGDSGGNIEPMRVHISGRRFEARALLCALFAGLLIVAQSFAGRAGAQEWSPPTTVWVESAGHTVDGLFLDFWRDYRNLLGNPITEEFKQTGLSPVGPATPTPRDESDQIVVQYFERGAIAYLPDNEPGEQVVMLPLGREATKYVPRKLQKALDPAGSCGGLEADDCLVDADTDFSLRYGFKSYWESNEGERLLGRPISEELVGSDSYTLQYFENGVLQWKDGENVTTRDVGTEVAKRLKLDTKTIDQPQDLPAYDESLFVEPAQIGVGANVGAGPGPQQGGYKEIVVSKSQATMWAYEAGAVVISSLVSIGTGETPEVTTPSGYFSILTKYDVQTMEGTISNEYYRVDDVPDVMYFDNLGNALHGAYWHNNFGAPMSHGCINLPLDIAAFLYDWAPIGTPVTVLE